jgi:hypothetical protein
LYRTISVTNYNLISNQPVTMSHQRYNLRPRNPHRLISPGQKYTTIHLRLLSPELQDVVLAISLLRTDGKTPALLVALRADEELYSQALKVYYSVNEMGLTWTDELEWFDSLRKEILGMVKKVVVAIP